MLKMEDSVAQKVPNSRWYQWSEMMVSNRHFGIHMWGVNMMTPRMFEILKAEMDRITPQNSTKV